VRIVLKPDFRFRVALVLALFLFLGIAWSAEELPTRLSDEAFWGLVSDFSEPGGRFPSDNFSSNELAIQHILPELEKGRKAGGAYLGVGPEQNFTYIVALKPKIAFIVDIRRQNLIEHLMYKALIEMSTDRADFLSRLFSRPRPADAGKNSTATALFEGFHDVDPDQAMFEQNYLAIRDRLIKQHQFKLTPDDENVLGYVLRAFFVGGPNLGYPGPQTVRPGVARLLPTYEELMIDTDQNGQQQSFLASEENFQTLQSFEKSNLIVPIVGDFAGTTALRSVGEYLKKHNTNVSAFYLSNVEQYLFMNSAAGVPNEDWKAFYKNVGTLPLDAKSVFIRPLINTPDGYSSSPQFRPGYHFDTLLFSIRDLVAAFNAGSIATYYDVIQVRN
jgi:hypothetical protein